MRFVVVSGVPFFSASATVASRAGARLSATRSARAVRPTPRCSAPCEVFKRLTQYARTARRSLRVLKLHDAAGSAQLLQGLAEAVVAGWAIAGRLHRAVGVHRNRKVPGDVGGRTILADYVEIADPPRLGLLKKADDCKRDVGGKRLGDGSSR